MKKVFSVAMAAILCAAVSVSAFAADPELSLWSIRGPSAVSLVSMFVDRPAVPGFTLKMETLAGADLMAAKFISGEAKLVILPANMAAKIASSGKKVTLLAVTGSGMLSLISADPAVRRIDDLKGKTVVVAGQGATPEFVFKKILETHKLAPDKDVMLNFSLGYPEIAQSLITGKIPFAILPEPFTTVALEGNRKLFTVSDIQDEWEAATGANDYPITVLAGDGDFVAQNPAAVKAILAAVKSSIGWVKANPAEAALLSEKQNFGLKARVLEIAIPRSRYNFVPAAQARPALETLYKSFLQYAPESIGGKLPADSFYYNPGK